MQRNLSANPFSRVPDLRSLNAMRLIASTEENESCGDTEALSHILFDSIWKEKKDVSDISVLQQIGDEFGMNCDVHDIVNNKSSFGRHRLIENTEEALARGAFGVPSFWVNDRLYFGVDRMHFVERELGNDLAVPYRIKQNPKDGQTKMKKVD